MKKILLSGLLLIVGAVLEICAQSIILDNKLQFESADALSSPPEGWSFTNCSLEKVNESSKFFVRLNNGSFTTERLTGLTGNARINFLIYPFAKDYEFSLSVEGEGVLDRNSASYEIESWRRGRPFLLRKANADSRIVFSGNNIAICNIEVSEMNDVLFYESFDRCVGTGGNDGIYSITSDALTLGKLDNPIDYEIQGITLGNKCICFPQNLDNNSNRAYKTPPIPSDDTDSYSLLFRALKAKDNGRLIVQYYSKTIQKWKNISVSLDYQEWKDISLLFDDMDASKEIRFIGSLIFLDELKVYEVKALPMSESSSETSIPAEWLNKTVCMSLTRTFQKDIWNTCCLPFDFDASLLHKATGNNDLTVELRHLSDITSEGIYHFGTITTVPAGEPFLLKVGENVSNPEFRNVVVKALTPASATSPSAAGYAFAGCYGKTTLATDGTHVFIGTDGLLHRPTETGNTMKGMRAYMVLPSNQSARGLVFDDTPTAIEALKPTSVSPSSDVLYNLSGQRVAKPAKGLYIKNGKKIIVNHK